MACPHCLRNIVFVPNLDYSAESFKVTNKPYLEYCAKNLTSKYELKTFLHILKRILNEKYPSVDSDFCLSSRTKNVHMGLNFNLLTLHNHDQIISNIEKIWLKRQDMNFEFVVPQLIHITKWKFDYIIFIKNTDF